MSVVDITVLGGGDIAETCRELLRGAGCDADEVTPGSHRPVIVGHSPHVFLTIRSLVEAGHHVLVACPAVLTVPQLVALFAGRGLGQVLSLWSESRRHPGHRLVAGLVEADEQAWHPRYIRQVTSLDEKPGAGLMRWRLLEAIALVAAYAGVPPLTLTATASLNPSRGCPDQEILILRYENLEAYIQVSLGEPMARRETLIAAAARKAYVDELNCSTPVRLFDDEPAAARKAARRISCPSPSSAELSRQQCLAFVEATQNRAVAEAEARLWLQALAVLQVAESSLAADGAPRSVGESAPSQSRLAATGKSISSSRVGRPPLLRLVAAR